MFHGGKSHPHSEMKVMFSKGGRHATIWDGPFYWNKTKFEFQVYHFIPLWIWWIYVIFKSLIFFPEIYE